MILHAFLLTLVAALLPVECAAGPPSRSTSRQGVALAALAQDGLQQVKIFSGRKGVGPTQPAEMHALQTGHPLLRRPAGSGAGAREPTNQTARHAASARSLSERLHQGSVSLQLLHTFAVNFGTMFSGRQTCVAAYKPGQEVALWKPRMDLISTSAVTYVAHEVKPWVPPPVPPPAPRVPLDARSSYRVSARATTGAGQ